MNCPRCQIPLSRHDHWCSKCNTYYSLNVTNGNADHVTPAANPAAQTPFPQAFWNSGGAAVQPSSYQPPAPAYVAPPSPLQSGGSNRGRFMVGGVSLGTIAVLLRGINLIYHTQQDYADKAAQNARDAQNFQQSAGQTQTGRDGGVDGFVQAHEDSRALMRNQQQQMIQQQQMMQAQMQQQAGATRQLQAQQASLRSMNSPTSIGPAPTAQPGFSPMGPSGPVGSMGGGPHFDRH